MIIVHFKESVRQRSEVQISIRSFYSEKIVYEKKTFDDLWASPLGTPGSLVPGIPVVTQI
jgi:hypothetical protein